MRAEHIDAVRDRVLTLIKGKKLVGYHLPQKIADLGLLGDMSEQPMVEKVEKAETNPTVPNPLTEKERPPTPSADKSDKKKAVLQITEAYDMAKVFNAQLSAQQ